MAAKKKKTVKKATRKKPTAKRASPPVHEHHDHAMHQHKPMMHTHKQVGLGVGILGLVLNIIIPGLGSLVSRRIFSGSWQLLIFVVGFVLSQQFAMIGFVIWLLAWIWALITSIGVIRNAI